MKTLRTLLLLVCAAALASCQQPPMQPTPDPGPAASAPGNPAPAAQAPLPPVAPVPTGPVTPAMQQQAQRITMAALGLLEAGREDEAKAELQRALASDPNNKLALNLMRQIGVDPQAALGADSFSYTVRANETLSMIAGRFLGDIYAFYILARYNGIAVPRQVAGGQTLRIPGKAPTPAAQREMAREASRESAREAPRETARAEPSAPTPLPLLRLPPRPGRRAPSAPCAPASGRAARRPRWRAGRVPESGLAQRGRRDDQGGPRAQATGAAPLAERAHGACKAGPRRRHPRLGPRAACTTRQRHRTLERWSGSVRWR